MNNATSTTTENRTENVKGLSFCSSSTLPPHHFHAPLALQRMAMVNLLRDKKLQNYDDTFLKTATKEILKRRTLERKLRMKADREDAKLKAIESERLEKKRKELEREKQLRLATEKKRMWNLLKKEKVRSEKRSKYNLMMFQFTTAKRSRKEELAAKSQAKRETEGEKTDELEEMFRSKLLKMEQRRQMAIDRENNLLKRELERVVTCDRDAEGIAKEALLRKARVEKERETKMRKQNEILKRKALFQQEDEDKRRLKTLELKRETSILKAEEVRKVRQDQEYSNFQKEMNAVESFVRSASRYGSQFLPADVASLKKENRYITRKREKMCEIRKNLSPKKVPIGSPFHTPQKQKKQSADTFDNNFLDSFDETGEMHFPNMEERSVKGLFSPSPDQDRGTGGLSTPPRNPEESKPPATPQDFFKHVFVEGGETLDIEIEETDTQETDSEETEENSSNTGKKGSVPEKTENKLPAQARRESDPNDFSKFVLVEDDFSSSESGNDSHGGANAAERENSGEDSETEFSDEEDRMAYLFVKKLSQQNLKRTSFTAAKQPAVTTPLNKKMAAQASESTTSTPTLQRGFSFAFSPSTHIPSPKEIDSMSPLQRTYTALKLTRGEDPAITRMKELIKTATG